MIAPTGYRSGEQSRNQKAILPFAAGASAQGMHHDAPRPRDDAAALQALTLEPGDSTAADGGLMHVGQVPKEKAAARKGAIIALAAIVLLAGCGPTFQQMTAADCAGIATDTAYEACQRRLTRQLADERLGYIVRSQVVR